MTITIAKRNEYLAAQCIPFMNNKPTLDPQGGLKSKIHPHSSPDVLDPTPKNKILYPIFKSQS
jgi:hypothetical protein